MTIKLTRDQLAAMHPCDADRRLTLFGRRKTMTARQALAAGATIGDLLWVAGRLGLKRECVQFALLCAQRTAHLNTDPRVQAAIDAARAWAESPTEENRLAARSAAAAAAESAESAVYKCYTGELLRLLKEETPEESGKSLELPTVIAIAIIYIWPSWALDMYLHHLAGWW